MAFRIQTSRGFCPRSTSPSKRIGYRPPLPYPAEVSLARGEFVPARLGGGASSYYGVIKAEHLAPFAARLDVLEILLGPGLAPHHVRLEVAATLGRLHGQRRRAIRQWHPGIDCFEAWRRTATGRPDFYRVSRRCVHGPMGDDSRARAEGWTLHEVMQVLWPTAPS